MQQAICKPPEALPPSGQARILTGGPGSRPPPDLECCSQQPNTGPTQHPRTIIQHHLQGSVKTRFWTGPDANPSGRCEHRSVQNTMQEGAGTNG